MIRARVCRIAIATLVPLCAVAASAQPTRPDAPATAPLLDRMLPLEAIVNGQKSGSWLFVERQGELYVPRDALDEWRVQERSGVEPIFVRGTEYFPLRGIPGFDMKVNFSTQSVEIRFAPEAFAATKLTQELTMRPKLSPVLPSVFVNYDLNFSATRPRLGADARDLGALLELGGSNDWGVLTSSHVGRHLAGTERGSSLAGWQRLETTFTRNFAESNHTLRVGDSGTRSGLWGRSVYFGGLQYGTNYGLTPGFITQPLPILAGVSAAPSTVELYVNDQLRRVSQVPAGPFAIDNTIGITGSGEARLVVRDVLGREVVIVQPFFTSAQLLAKGLDDWSVETGWLRRNLGLPNSGYGGLFASGLWRRGVTDTVTLEGRGEFERRLQVAGFGAIVALPADILARAVVSASRHASAGSGHQWLAGMERQWTRTSLNMQVQGATRGYRELGMPDVFLPTRLQWAANLSHAFAGSTLGLGLARVQRFDAEPVTTVSTNYSTRIGKASSLSLSAGRVIGEGGGTSLGVSVQVPLENNRMVTAAANSREGSNDFYVTAMQTSGFVSDIGWRVLAGRLQNQAHAEGGLNYEGPHGRAYAELSADRGQTSLRTGAAGGLVYAANRFFVTKRVEESFAVAEIKDHGGVGIGLGGNPITFTDAKGIAFLPYLSPYQENQVRLDPRDLPVSAELDSIEQLVVPAWRSAVKVDFPVRTGRAALVKIHLDDGEPIPAGAVASIEGDAQKQEFFVGRRGEAFVTGLQPRNVVVVRHKGQRCRMDVNLPVAANDEIIRLGPVACKGVKR